MACPDLPAPPTSGGRVRTFHLLRELGHRHDVDVLAPALPEPEAIEATRAVSRSLTVFPVRREGPTARGGRWIRSTLVGRLHHPDPGVRAAFVAAVRDRRYDVLHLVTPYLVPSLPATVGGVPVLVDFFGTSLGAWREVRLARGLSRWLSRLARWSAAVRGERWVLRRVDGAVAISETDRQYLARLAPPSARIRVVPNGVDGDYFAPRPEPEAPRTIAFVGDMGFAPNVDAARHLVGTVLPKLQARVPDVTLWLVGRDPAPAVAALARPPEVRVTGTVADVRPYLARAAVVVVPLRSGSGVRNKTLEAMAMGRPVVSTGMGVEGLDVTPGRDLLVADDADDFADAVAGLLASADRRRALGEAARARVRAAYDWPASARRLEAVYRELCGDPTRATAPARAC